MALYSLLNAADFDFKVQAFSYLYTVQSADLSSNYWTVTIPLPKPYPDTNYMALFSIADYSTTNPGPNIYFYDDSVKNPTSISIGMGYIANATAGDIIEIDVFLIHP